MSTTFQTPEFYNDALVHTWDETEIHPVREIGEGEFETCDPDEADFWSVYVHHVEPAKHGSLACIADVPTKRHAEELVDMIELIVPKKAQ